HRADGDEHQQRHHLGDSQEHAGAGGRAYADDVDRDQEGQRAGHDRDPRAAAGGARPEVGHRLGQAVAERGGAGDAGQHLHPADLEADERAEGFARVQVAAAGLVEIARRLRVAQHQQAYRKAREQDAPQAGRAEQRRRRGRQQVDAAADDVVDREAVKLPAPDGAAEGRSWCRRGIGHSAGKLARPATSGASATIAPTMQAPNSAPSIAPVAAWRTSPTPGPPNSAPRRSRRRREPSKVLARSSRLPPIRRPPDSGTTIPTTAPATVAATTLRRVHGARPPRAPNHRPKPTEAPSSKPSGPPVMSPGERPSSRLKASSPSSFTTAPTSMPPSAPPAMLQRQRGPGSSADAAMPALTPAPPATAATIVRHTITSSIETAPMPGASGCEAPTKP